MNNKFTQLLLGFSKYLSENNVALGLLKIALSNHILNEPIDERTSGATWDEIQEVQDASKMVCIVLKYCSFFNYKFLENLMNITEYKAGQHLMAKYKEDFANYVNEIAVNENPDGTGMHGQEGILFSVELDESFKYCRQFYLDVLTLDLCDILGVRKEFLHIRRVVKGCVRVIFHLPILFKDMVFPLTEENTQAFRCLNYEGAQVLRIIHENKIYRIND